MNLGSSFVDLLDYADDIIFTGSDIIVITSSKVFLHSQFKLKDLDQFKYFLGLEIAQ